jgi:uracil-DNA glycosylase family 4
LTKVCEVDACKGCPLRNKFPDQIFVAPRVGSNLRLEIGEAPSSTEADEGSPFAGSSGGWLRNIYAKAGLREQDNSALNVIQCQPPGNVFPTDPKGKEFLDDKEAHRAIEHCRVHHLEPFMATRPWVRIDTFGDKPLRHVLGKASGIGNWRGSILPVPALGNRKIAIPTFHPSYIAKDQAMFPVAINDILKTLDIDPEQYNIYPSIADVRAFRHKKFAFDIETAGWTKEIRMVGLCAEDFTAIVVPFIGEYVDELKRIFIEADEVVGQNIVQFDLPVLAHNGVHVRSPLLCMVWDTMLMHHLRFPVFPHDLEFIGKQFTNKGAWKSDKVSYETYCARDVDVTWRSYGALDYLLRQAGLHDLYKYVSWPLAKICRLMTDTGITRSSSRILTLREELKAGILKNEQFLPEELRTTILRGTKRKKAPPGTVDDAGEPVKWLHVPFEKEVVPWRSVEVKKHFLYEVLRDPKGKKLPVQEHIKTKKPTADKNALDRLYARYKLPELKALKELNKSATLLSNFAKTGTELAAGGCDRVHPSFNVHGTESGRLSSSGPNIQNQPQAVRYTYVPRNAGGKILSVDYSGIENRLVAWMAKDRKRQAWFRDPDFSEHKHLASLRQGIPYGEVEKSKDKDSPYAISKIIVHGSDRMMGSLKISKQFDLDFNTVKDFQAMWKREIADTIAWQSRIGNSAARVGWLANVFGRKIWLWETNSATKAVSFMPQSTAADVIYRAMIALMYERIDWPKEWAQKVAPIVEPLPEGALLLAQVHDELLTETDNAELTPRVLEVLTKVMTQPWPELDGLSLPIGTGVGDSWGDCE